MGLRVIPEENRCEEHEPSEACAGSTGESVGNKAAAPRGPAPGDRAVPTLWERLGFGASGVRRGCTGAAQPGTEKEQTPFRAVGQPCPLPRPSPDAVSAPPPPPVLHPGLPLRFHLPPPDQETVGPAALRCLSSVKGNSVLTTENATPSLTKTSHNSRLQRGRAAALHGVARSLRTRRSWGWTGSAEPSLNGPIAQQHRVGDPGLPRPHHPTGKGETTGTRTLCSRRNKTEGASSQISRPQLINNKMKK